MPWIQINNYDPYNPVFEDLKRKYFLNILYTSALSAFSTITNRLVLPISINNFQTKMMGIFFQNRMSQVKVLKSKSTFKRNNVSVVSVWERITANKNTETTRKSNLTFA